MSLDQAAVDVGYLVGETDAPKPPHVQRNRCFPFIVVVCVLEGCYRVAGASGGREAAAKPGEAVIVPEQMPHAISMREEGRLTWAHVCCRVGGRDVLAGLRGPGVVTGEAARQVREMCERLNAMAGRPSGVRSLLDRHGTLAQLGAVLMEALSPAEWPVSGVVREAMEMIERDPAGKLDISALGTALGLSASALEKRFRAETGISPLRYQRECRIRRAAGLLMAGLRVNETAYLVGYSDPYYFSRVFRQSVGLSPAQYQKQYLPDR